MIENEITFELSNGWTMRGTETVRPKRKIQRVEIIDETGRVIGHSLEWVAETAPEPSPEPK